VDHFNSEALIVYDTHFNHLSLATQLQWFVLYSSHSHDFGGHIHANSPFHWESLHWNQKKRRRTWSGRDNPEVWHRLKIVVLWYRQDFTIHTNKAWHLHMDKHLHTYSNNSGTQALASTKLDKYHVLECLARNFAPAYCQPEGNRRTHTEQERVRDMKGT